MPIGSEYHDRVGGTAPERVAPFGSAAGYKLRSCYYLTKKYASSRWGVHAIKQASFYNLRDTRQPSFEKNCFYWGVLAIFPDSSTSDLRFQAEQILYADMHAVPPAFLVGFLMQSGSQRFLKKQIKINRRQEDFDLFRNQTRHIHPSP
jgi:hypothetical protein